MAFTWHVCGRAAIKSLEPQPKAAAVSDHVKSVGRALWLTVAGCDVQCWLPARALVEAALGARHDVDASGEVIELSTGGCPWKEHLYQLEKEQRVEVPVKYVIYQVRLRLAGFPLQTRFFPSGVPPCHDLRSQHTDPGKTQLTTSLTPNVLSNASSGEECKGRLCDASRAAGAPGFVTA